MHHFKDVLFFANYMYRECVHVHSEGEFFVIVAANDFLLQGASMNGGGRSSQCEVVVQVVLVGCIKQVHLQIQTEE